MSFKNFTVEFISFSWLNSSSNFAFTRASSCFKRFFTFSKVIYISSTIFSNVDGGRTGKRSRPPYCSPAIIGYFFKRPYIYFPSLFLVCVKNLRPFTFVSLPIMGQPFSNNTCLTHNRGQTSEACDRLALSNGISFNSLQYSKKPNTRKPIFGVQADWVLTYRVF